MNKQLRLLAGNIVVESNMTTSSKIQLLNFIKEEATDTQIKALLMDGKIVKLDEQAEEIVNDRFKQHKLNEAGILGNILAAPIQPLWRSVAATFSDAHRQCGMMKISNDRDHCMAKARLGYATKKLELLSKSLSTCNDKRSPSACRNTLKNLIEKEKSKIIKQKEKMEKLMMKGRASTVEPAKFVTTRM